MDFAEVRRADQQKIAAQPAFSEIATVTAVAATHLVVMASGVEERVTPRKGIFYAVADRVTILRTGTATIEVAKIAGSDPTPLPKKGTVTAVPSGSSTVTVSTVIGSFTARFVAPYVPANGHSVAIDWDGDEPRVLGNFGTTSVPPPPVVPPPPPVDPPAPPPPPPAPPATGVSFFPAVAAGSYRNGRWRTDSNVVAQFDWGGYGNNTGAWFYGDAPRSLAGRTVTGCRIQVRRRDGGTFGPQALHLWRHLSSTRPVTNVSLVDGPIDSSIAIGETQWINLTASRGQSIVDGGGGFGITGSPYVVLDGLDRHAESGLLEISWTQPA